MVGTGEEGTGSGRDRVRWGQGEVGGITFTVITTRDQSGGIHRYRGGPQTLLAGFMAPETESEGVA